MEWIIDKPYIPHAALILTKKAFVEDFSLQKIYNNTNRIWELEIHPVDYCLLNCHGCSYSKRHSDSEISYDDLVKYVDSNILRGLNCIFLSGGGDPCNWSRLRDFLLRYKNDQCLLGMSTNLYNPLDLKESSAINHIQIHIIGYNKESTIAECGVDAFERFTNNLYSLIENLNKGTTVTLKLLLNNNNYKNLSQLLDYVNWFNADTIVIKTIQNFARNTKIWNDVNNTYIRRVVSDHPVVNRFDYAIDNLNDIVFNNPVPKECYVAKRALYRLVRTNGDIYPCVAGTITTKNRIGSIFSNVTNEEIDFSQSAIAEKCPLQACRHYRFNSYLEKHGFPVRSMLGQERLQLL